MEAPGSGREADDAGSAVGLGLLTPRHQELGVVERAAPSVAEDPREGGYGGVGNRGRASGDRSADHLSVRAAGRGKEPGYRAAGPLARRQRSKAGAAGDRHKAGEDEPRSPPGPER